LIENKNRPLSVNSFAAAEKKRLFQQPSPLLFAVKVGL